MMPFVIDWRNRILIANVKNSFSKPAVNENTGRLWEEPEVEKINNISRIDRRANSFKLGIFTVYLFFGIYLILTLFQMYIDV